MPSSRLCPRRRVANAQGGRRTTRRHAGQKHALAVSRVVTGATCLVILLLPPILERSTQWAHRDCVTFILAP
jgi:hypothetical protein